MLLSLEDRDREGLAPSRLPEARCRLRPCECARRQAHAPCPQRCRPPAREHSSEREARAASAKTPIASAKTPIASAEGDTHERERPTRRAKWTRHPVDAGRKGREPRGPAGEEHTRPVEAETSGRDACTPRRHRDSPEREGGFPSVEADTHWARWVCPSRGARPASKSSVPACATAVWPLRRRRSASTTSVSGCATWARSSRRCVRRFSREITR